MRKAEELVISVPILWKRRFTKMVKAEPEPKSSDLYPDMPPATLGFFHRSDLTVVSDNETVRTKLL